MLPPPTAAGRLLDRPGLGLSFRLLVPLPNRRNNNVFGEQQRVASVEPAPDGRSVRFAWDGVDSQHGGRLDIKLALTVHLTARQAIYTMTVDNRCPYIVENVYCPYLGDVQRPPSAEWFKTFVYQYASAQEWSIWPSFQNLRGYYGVDYPTQVSPWSASSGAPMSPYILLRDADQGLYVGVDEPRPDLVAWHLELRPGYGESIAFHQAARTVDRRQRGGRAFCRGARPLYPARRDPHADADHAGSLQGRLAGAVSISTSSGETAGCSAPHCRPGPASPTAGSSCTSTRRKMNCASASPISCQDR